METPLILNSPVPAPPSETVVWKLAELRALAGVTLPRLDALTSSLVPLLDSRATDRKLEVSVALPTTNEAPPPPSRLRVIVSVVAS